MKTITGKVVSNKTPKMVVVEVVRFVAHPMYHKRVRRTKKYHAHTENPLNLGDKVRLVETAPISQTKRFTVKEVMKK